MKALFVAFDGKRLLFEVVADLALVSVGWINNAANISVSEPHHYTTLLAGERRIAREPTCSNVPTVFSQVEPIPSKSCKPKTYVICRGIFVARPRLHFATHIPGVSYLVMVHSLLLMIGRSKLKTWLIHRGILVLRPYYIISTFRPIFKGSYNTWHHLCCRPNRISSI